MRPHTMHGRAYDQILPSPVTHKSLDVKHIAYPHYSSQEATRAL